MGRTRILNVRLLSTIKELYDVVPPTQPDTYSAWVSHTHSRSTKRLPGLFLAWGKLKVCLQEVTAILLTSFVIFLASRLKIAFTKAFKRAFLETTLLNNACFYIPGQLALNHCYLRVSVESAGQCTVESE